MRAEIGLPASIDSPRAARRFARVVLEAWNLPAQVDVVALLLSELVTNSVIHGRSEVTVVLRNDGSCLRADVRDASSGQPTRPPFDTSEVGGRGLFLVEAMSRASGVEIHTVGKSVWFELPLVGQPTGSVMAGLADEVRSTSAGDRHRDIRKHGHTGADGHRLVDS